MQHKDYKQKRRHILMERMGRKGQVTIYVIIALVIVGIIMLVFLYPRISQIVAPKEINPKTYLESCIEPDVKNIVDTLARQGGYQNPTGYMVYDDAKVKYLCYTSNYYETCMVQQPLIKAHFEDELNRMMKNNAERCLASLDSAYKEQGYSVTRGTLNAVSTIEPGKIRILFTVPMTVKKGETTTTFDSFDTEIASQIYDLVFIAHSIVEYEATYGDSETTAYMSYYPDLKIEKIRTNDGSKVYRITNVVTNEIFMFASRSLAWPPGYGL